MASKLEWAQYWAGEGFFVFPVVPNAKNPLIQDWPSLASRDPAVITGWWGRWPDANIGAHPGASGHAVLDIDTKDGKAGKESLEALEALEGELPETLRVTTASGGTHIWLTLAGACGNSAGKLGEGIDTRGRRGFVVMPGSAIDGRKYRIAVNAPPAEAPESWAALLRSIGAPEEKREATGAWVDTPEQLNKARRYLETLVADDDVAVEGQGGNDRTFRLAAALHDLGLSQEAAEALADEIWNVACAPPWAADELSQIFENAYNYAQNEHGAKSGGDPTGAGFACIPQQEAAAPPPAGRRDRFSLLNIAEMASLPEPAWLVPGWIPLYSTTVLYGKPGSMKSFAALDAALSLASGQSCWGLTYEAKAHPVVYVAGEGQIGVGKQRIPAWLAHNMRQADIPFHMIQATPRALNMQEDLAAMFSAIEAKCGSALPRLVVYDTHARVMSGLDENSAQDTAKALELYDATVARYSCAVVAIHHSGKDGGSERGSTALGAGVDAVLRMDYEKGQRIAMLSCEKMKDAEQGKPLAFSPHKVGDSIVLRPAAPFVPEKQGPSQLYVDIVAILKKNDAHNAGRAMSTSAVAAQLPCVLDCDDAEERETARRRMEKALQRLAKKELKVLAAEAQGFWQLDAPPQE